jgi:hypothetical protein
MGGHILRKMRRAGETDRDKKAKRAANTQIYPEVCFHPIIAFHHIKATPIGWRFVSVWFLQPLKSCRLCDHSEAQGRQFRDQHQVQVHRHFPVPNSQQGLCDNAFA